MVMVIRLGLRLGLELWLVLVLSFLSYEDELLSGMG
jgi:hypothetical protein